MNDINIKGTFVTPKIIFNKEDKHLIIEGISTIENPTNFYKPLIAKLKDQVKDLEGKLEIDFKLLYFNSKSSIAILSVLKHLHSLSSENNEVVINWHYDKHDEDILDKGEVYSDILNHPFNLVAIAN